MKQIIRTMLAVAVLSASFNSFAQSNESLSRTQVRAELAQVEKAGYKPTAEEANYPANLQIAESQVSEQRVSQAQSSSYGASTGASTASGGASKRIDPQGVFFGQ